MKAWQQLVDELGLLAHPEGGFYKETYRSELTLDGQQRNLLTSIYFFVRRQTKVDFFLVGFSC